MEALPHTTIGGPTQGPLIHWTNDNRLTRPRSATVLNRNLLA